MKQFPITIESIQEALKHPLPGRNAHLKMAPIGRSLNLPNQLHKVKTSAILILLYPLNNQLYFCLTKRNSQLKHHPGQLSFPGGRCEKGENPNDTALRETNEEIGIEPSSIRLIGELSTLYIPVSNFIIHPYIGSIANEPIYNINRFEVDELITLPLQSILDDENKQSTLVITSNGPIVAPCYNINGHIIWGATSMMIAELEAILRR